MWFQFTASVSGGLGPDAWDEEITVSGEDMTIRQALDEVERRIAAWPDCAIVWIEQTG